MESIQITPWSKSWCNDDIRDECKYEHNYWCPKKNAHCTVRVWEIRNRYGQRKEFMNHVLKITYTSDRTESIHEMSLTGTASFEVLRAALRHAKGPNETKANYFFRQMGIPECYIDPPFTRVTGRKRKGLPIMTDSGQLYTGGRECLYSFKLEGNKGTSSSRK